MMKKPRISVFFYSSFSVFVGTLILLYFSMLDKKSEGLLQKLFSPNYLHIPLIIYLFTFSLIIGLTVLILVEISEKRYDKKIEEELRLLIRQEYGKVIDVESREDNPHLTNEGIHQTIHLLAEKMQRMSEQLQSADTTGGGGTANKEEILKKERLRLSRELHDSVSQELFAATMILSGVNEQVQQQSENENLVKQIGVVTEIINTAQGEMRALLLHLRPIELSGKSLKQGIEQLLMELQTKIKIHLIWDVDEISVPSQVEDELFRIVQELLSNTLRHAKANTLEVYLKRIGDNVLLKVEDDGIGFDMNQKKSASYGLTSIHERVLGLGGEDKIISFVGKGTSIEIRVPIVKEVKK